MEYKRITCYRNNNISSSTYHIQKPIISPIVVLKVVTRNFQNPKNTIRAHRLNHGKDLRAKISLSCKKFVNSLNKSADTVLRSKRTQAMHHTTKAHTSSHFRIRNFSCLVIRVHNTSRSKPLKRGWQFCKFAMRLDKNLPL